MKRNRKTLGTVALAAMLLGLLAGPAGANADYAGTITDGSAEVGKWFVTDFDCTKDGAEDAQVAGRGLYVVGTSEDKARERHGVWKITTPVTFFSSKKGTEEQAGMLHACGWLDRIGPDANTKTTGRYDGIGAACGASKGFGGRGFVEDEHGQKLVKLSDLGWKQAIGGLLPVNGNYEEYVTDGPTKGHKNDKGGAVKAEIVAFGGQRCLDLNGAQEFDITGTFELLNGDLLEDKTPNDPNGDGTEEFPKDTPDSEKECKKTGPDQKTKKSTNLRECPETERDKPNTPDPN